MLSVESKRTLRVIAASVGLYFMFILVEYLTNFMLKEFYINTHIV